LEGLKDSRFSEDQNLEKSVFISPLFQSQRRWIPNAVNAVFRKADTRYVPSISVISYRTRKPSAVLLSSDWLPAVENIPKWCRLGPAQEKKAHLPRENLKGGSAYHLCVQVELTNSFS